MLQLERLNSRYPLLVACKLGDYSLVNYLSSLPRAESYLQFHHDNKQRVLFYGNRHKECYLEYVIKSNNVAITKLLLAKGKMSSNEREKTALLSDVLYLACSLGHVPIVQLFLSHGAVLSCYGLIPPEETTTYLMAMAEIGEVQLEPLDGTMISANQNYILNFRLRHELDTIITLEDDGADEEMFQSCCKFFIDLPHYVKDGDSFIIAEFRSYLQAGCDYKWLIDAVIKSSNSDCNSNKKHNCDIMWALLEMGLLKDAYNLSCYNHHNSLSRLLYQACVSEQWDLTKQIYAEGGRFEARISQNNSLSSLLFTCDPRNAEVENRKAVLGSGMVEAGMDVDIIMTDSGSTLLMVLCQSLSCQAVKVLLTAGASVTAKTKDGRDWTAMTFALSWYLEEHQQATIEVVSLLLQANADPWPVIMKIFDHPRFTPVAVLVATILWNNKTKLRVAIYVIMLLILTALMFLSAFAFFQALFLCRLAYQQH